MSGLKLPRRKRRIYQQQDSPFPVPIESITRKPASSSRWFYYTGLLQENCVFVQQEGDVIFLYKMGFFGKGMLSKSKPEHSVYMNSYQGHHKKNLPPRERRFQQQRFQQVRKKRYERHLSWSKQFVMQTQNPTSEIDGVTTRTDDVTKRTDDVTTRTDDVTTRTDDATTRTDDVTTTTDDVSTRTDDVTTRTDDVTTRTDDVTTRTDDVTTRTDDVTTRTDDVATRTDDVTTRTDDVSTRTDDITTRTDDVTKRTDDVTKRTDDVTTRTDDVTTRTDDATTRTDDATTRTDDATTRTDDVTTRTDDAATRTDDVTTRTDDVTTRTDDVIVKNKLAEQSLSAIKGFDKIADMRTNVTELDDGKQFEVDMEVTMETKEVKSSSSDLLDTEGGGTENGTQERQNVRKVDPYPIHEYLSLKFEEAFFLSYGLGCLSVLDANKKALDLTEMWQAFCSRQRNFVASYVAYHYFRSKGWVPRNGIKYGAHYVLYKHGPPFYHGSYSVIVQMVTEGLWDCSEASNRLTWPALSGMDRITETVAKEVMFCYVIRPSDLSDEDMLSPKCIPRFRVQEIVIRRWVSSRERDEKNQLTSVIS